MARAPTADAYFAYLFDGEDSVQEALPQAVLHARHQPILQNVLAVADAHYGAAGTGLGGLWQAAQPNSTSLLQVLAEGDGALDDSLHQLLGRLGASHEESTSLIEFLPLVSQQGAEANRWASWLAARLHLHAPDTTEERQRFVDRLRAFVDEMAKVAADASAYVRSLVDGIRTLMELCLGQLVGSLAVESATMPDRKYDVATKPT